MVKNTQLRLYQLLCGINRYLRSNDPKAPNLVDNKNPEFAKLHRTMDRYFRQLRIHGVGAEVKHAATISNEEENLLWEHNLCSFAPCFATTAKFFCLRGGKEHGGLKPSQFTCSHTPKMGPKTEVVSFGTSVLRTRLYQYMPTLNLVIEMLVVLGY